MERFESEFVVVQGSPIIGKTIQEIEGKFGIEIDHYHNPKIDVATRKKPEPTDVINAYWTLKAFGTYEQIVSLRKFSVSF